MRSSDLPDPAILPDPSDKAAVARSLAAIERRPDAPSTLSVLHAAYKSDNGRVIGMTGPPGVGKSTLLGELIAAYRAAGQSVGVIAVDPSSHISGGALLGDRTRLATDPSDAGIFVRSMAARDKLGGLAGLTIAAMVLMRALYDVVLVETVGVGQSETDVRLVADTVLFCVQPASGDSLQFMKSGILEVPHVIAVTKADIGAAAKRARADVIGSVSLSVGHDGSDWETPVILVSAAERIGIADLINALDGHRQHLLEIGRLAQNRQAQAVRWLEDSIRSEFGRAGLATAREFDLLALDGNHSPFTRIAEAHARLQIVGS